MLKKAYIWCQYGDRGQTCNIGVTGTAFSWGFGGLGTPPPYFGGGESIFEDFGVWSDGMLRPFSLFLSLLHVLGARRLTDPNVTQPVTIPAQSLKNIVPYRTPSHTSLKSPFEDCSEKVQYTPPPEHHAP